MYIKEHILSSLRDVLTGLGIDSPDIEILRPRDPSHGDLSTNVAMVYSKKLGRKPHDFANELIRKMEVNEDYISAVKTAGSGFINFFISDDYYRDSIEKIDRNFGRLEINSGKRANVEWVSANPTGPLHTGHGRQIALGKAIANLLEWTGYEVTREYYYNDAGRQMERLAESVYARYRQIIEPDYKFPEDAYHGDYVKEIALEIFNEYDDRLIDSDNEIFRKKAEDWCFRSIRNTLDRMGVIHNVFFNESSLYSSGKIEQVLESFAEKNLSYEKDGAIWLKTSVLLGNKKDAQDKVIVKSTGEPTYRLPDMAYHVDKIKRGYDLIIDIFGSDHGDTYKEVLAGVKGLGYDVSNIRVIIHQMVTFVSNGQPVKMSKRSDNVYYLDDLLDDVGEDVAQFFFVMRSPNTHLEFDISLAKEQSEKNPVFYLQYAHARICGILRNAENTLGDFLKAEADTSRLNNAEEIQLMKTLAYFPEIVESSYTTLEPHRIITYLNEVAENFHRFYHNHRVLDPDDKELSQARLKLCKATKIVLANGFEIIGIRAPERM
ncbi:MAG: arginine--tRNA ligase [Ignavibacteria bacterium]|nr:arginine--tRNA ligase [Ignavibacteria bacterium]